MSKNIAETKDALPATLTNLATGLAQSIAHSASGGAFMKFTKFGEWLYGAEEIVVEEGSEWAINPQGFLQGWIAWGNKEHNNEGEKLGEVMGAASEPMPAQPEPVDGTWSEQRGMQLACVSGDDEGTQVLYKSNSHGGLKAYNSVILEVVKRIEAGEADIVPIVTLDADSYTHNTYGKIFTPEIKIVKWASMDQTAVEEEEPEPEEKPKRRTRRSRAA